MNKRIHLEEQNRDIAIESDHTTRFDSCLGYHRQVCFQSIAYIYIRKLNQFRSNLRTTK